MPSTQQSPAVQQVTNEHAQWFYRERGITSTTLEAFGVRSLADGAVSLPYPHGPKLRYGIPEGERQFRYPTGVALDFFTPMTVQVLAGTVLVCEGETDTMRLWQELSEAGHADKYAVVGIPGVEAWTEKMAQRLSGADKVLVFLDNDAPNQEIVSRYGKTAVNRVWGKMRRALGARVHRVDLAPAGVKDLCEFFNRFSLTDMKGLIEREPTYHYPALDLHLERPTTVDWLVEEMIGKGDRVMAIGDPGTGKSWLAMALTVAIASLGAGVDAKWLGMRPNITTGRVMFADEENPEAEVYRRLQLLGLPVDARENVRYLSQVGLRLDRDPDLLMDDVINFNPDLVVLDSLARFHSSDEQSAGEMARLFRDGITPLCRETGAACLVLHHKVKPSSHGKPAVGLAAARGSGDLSASIDQGFDVTADDRDTIRISHFKARRSLPHWPIRAMIYDEDLQVKVSVL